MTGLDSQTDVLLEVAMIITDGQLNALDDGVSYVVHTDAKVVGQMNAW